MPSELALIVIGHRQRRGKYAKSQRPTYPTRGERWANYLAISTGLRHRAKQRRRQGLEPQPLWV